MKPLTLAQLGINRANRDLCIWDRYPLDPAAALRFGVRLERPIEIRIPFPQELVYRLNHRDPEAQQEQAELIYRCTLLHLVMETTGELPAGAFGLPITDLARLLPRLDPPH